MEKSEFENLIAGCEASVKGKGVLLYNGYVKSASAYQQDATASNLKSFQAAEEALNDFVRETRGRTSQTGRIFKNRKAVFEYLRDQGVAVSKSKMYQDSDSGRLRIQPDKSVLLSDVDLYVKAYLSPKKKAGSNSDIEALQSERLELENKKLKQQIDKMEFEKDIAAGKYILKSDFEMEIATRAAIFDTSLRQMTAAKTYEWIMISKGDVAMTRELTAIINAEIDKLLNDYAATDKFHVIFVEGSRGQGFEGSGGQE